MKNLNQTVQTENDQNSEQNLSSSHLEFNDVMVYQEMADQTSVRLSLTAQVQSQMNQLDEMISRKQFMLKEIFNEIVK